MQKWLSRLSWTFLVLALVLFWDSYSAMQGFGRALPQWRIRVQLAMAAICAVLWLAGVRARHRRDADLAPPEHDENRND